MEQHGKYRALVGARAAGLALAALACGVAAPVAAQCRLALLLALDISSSVDAAEDLLQREGLAAALTAPEIVEVILAIPSQPVALAVFEWSGRYQQDMTLPWTLLTSREEVFAAAQTVAASQRRYAEFPTALGFAIGHAASVFEEAPLCAAQTLDISGDGRNNDGFGPRLAYENFPLESVTVNGLVIGGQDEGLAAYYTREVIKGPGSFVEQAVNFDDYERAMRRKLLRELQIRAVSLPQASPQGG